MFENKLINIVDNMVPLVNFVGKTIKEIVPRVIKNNPMETTDRY